MEEITSKVVIIQSLMDFELQKQEAKNKLVVICFFANWCGPSRLIAPFFEKLSIDFAEQAVFLKIDVERLEEIALEYGVTSMPTFIFLKSNRQYAFVGVNPDKLIQTVQKFVGSEPLPLQAELDEAEDYIPVLEPKPKQATQSQSKF